MPRKYYQSSNHGYTSPLYQSRDGKRVESDPYYFKSIMETLIDARYKWDEIEYENGKDKNYVPKQNPINDKTISWVSRYLNSFNKDYQLHTNHFNETTKEEMSLICESF